MTRPPAVYERKAKHRRYDEEDRIGATAWEEKFKSAAENAEAIHKRFDLEKTWGCSLR